MYNEWPEVSEEDMCDFNPYYFVPWQRELASPQYFAACLEAEDWATRYDCVMYLDLAKPGGAAEHVNEPVCP